MHFCCLFATKSVVFSSSSLNGLRYHPTFQPSIQPSIHLANHPPRHKYHVAIHSTNTFSMLILCQEEAEYRSDQATAESNSWLPTGVRTPWGQNLLFLYLQCIKYEYDLAPVFLSNFTSPTYLAVPFELHWSFCFWNKPRALLPQDVSNCCSFWAKCLSNNVNSWLLIFFILAKMSCP